MKLSWEWLGQYMRISKHVVNPASNFSFLLILFMYIILQILSEDLSQVVSVQGPGSHFGEIGFLFGAPRMSTVRAATHCQLVMLNKINVDKVVEHFPLIAK